MNTSVFYRNGLYFLASLKPVSHIANLNLKKIEVFMLKIGLKILFKMIYSYFALYYAFLQLNIYNNLSHLLAYTMHTYS